MEEANESAYQREKAVLDARYNDVLNLVDRPVKHRLRRDFFRVEVPLKSVICGTVIRRGQYTIPFSFSLPSNLSGSCRLGNPPDDLCACK